MDKTNYRCIKQESVDTLEKLERIYVTLSKNISRRFVDSPISMRDFIILKHLYDCEMEGTPTTSSDVSRIMNVSRSAVSQVVSSLEEREYIVGSADKNDKRKRYLHPSGKGIKTVREFKSCFSKDINAVCQGMGGERFNDMLSLAAEAVELVEDLEA